MKLFLHTLLVILFSAAANAADMSFGPIEFIAGANGLNATMSVTDGSITCTNSIDYTCPATGTRGSFLIAGTKGTQVQIHCEKEAQISNNTTILSILTAQVRVGSNSASCTGIKRTILTHTITGIQASDTLYNAGRLRVPNNTSNLEGAYSSSNSGGVPHAIRLIYI